VANGAPVDVTFAGFSQNVGRELPRVGFEPGSARNGEVARGAGNDCFETGRLSHGGEAVEQNAHAEIAGDNNYSDYQEKHNLPKLHAGPFSATSVHWIPPRGRWPQKSE